MNGSWYLGRLTGIDIRIHWTFLLLPVWIYFSSLAAGSGVGAATAAVAFVLAIFGCVLLHELGHSLMARQFGIPTRDITLLPIGGVARLQRMPRNPWQELAIAIAGPAVNVVIATLIFSGLSVLAITDPKFGGFVAFLSSACLGQCCTGPVQHVASIPDGWWSHLASECWHWHYPTRPQPKVRLVLGSSLPPVLRCWV